METLFQKAAVPETVELILLIDEMTSHIVSSCQIYSNKNLEI